MEPEWSLDGKVAIVTGTAPGGIGETYAYTLATAGAAVICADINAEGAAAVAADIEADGGSAIAVGVDISDEDSVAAGSSTSPQQGPSRRSRSMG